MEGTIQATPEKQRISRLETIEALLDQHLEKLSKWEKNYLLDMKFRLFRNMDLKKEDIDRYRKIRHKCCGY